MKDPVRLVESSGSEVERALLRSGREGASRGAKKRALAAATGVLAASTLTAGNAAGAAGAAGAGKAAVGAKAASLLSLKWIVVIGVASVGAVAGTVAVRTARTESPAVESTVAAPARPRTSEVSLSPRVVSPPAATALPSSAPPSAPPPVVRAVAPSITPSASAGSTSTAELALLDQARGAIADGDPARGLSILEGYRTRFPHGVMAPEATMLRIEALVNAGDRAAAKRAGDAFLQANPTSPYGARIRSLLGASNP